MPPIAKRNRIPASPVNNIAKYSVGRYTITPLKGSYEGKVAIFNNLTHEGGAFDAAGLLDTLLRSFVAQNVRIDFAEAALDVFFYEHF